MRLRRYTIRLLAVALPLTAWQLLATGVGQPELVPSLPRLAEASGELLISGRFYQSLGATLLRGLAGMSLSLGAATGMAWLFSRARWLYELFRPWLAAMRSVPVISFILLALIFLDPEGIPPLIAFLTMFPLLVENLTKGIVALDPSLSAMARQFRVGWLNRLTQVTYPQIKPFLFSGLSSAAGFGWRAIIMGEVLSQCAWGIGSEMKRAQAFIDVPELLAWTLAAALVSLAFDKLISHLSACSFPIRFTRRERPTPPETLPRLVADNIGYRYGIRHFSCRFERGVTYGVSAPSGCGKTTLLRLLAGELTPIEGRIMPPPSSYTAAWVFQSPTLLPRLTAWENVALPLAALHTKREARAIAGRLLTEMEIGDLAGRLPGTLSYGQQQRVALARALAFPAPLLLLDEPFKGLDEALARRVIDRVKRHIEEEPRITLFASHDERELSLLAGEKLLL